MLLHFDLEVFRTGYPLSKIKLKISPFLFNNLTNNLLSLHQLNGQMMDELPGVLPSIHEDLLHQLLYKLIPKIKKKNNI